MTTQAEKFLILENRRLDFAKELLLKGANNITPEQAADHANRLFWEVLSTDAPTEYGEADSEPLQPVDHQNSPLGKIFSQIGQSFGREKQRVLAVVEYVEQLPGFSAASAQPVVPDDRAAQ
jgi:hypothetical protein